MAVRDVGGIKCKWVSVWINSMCECLTTLWKSCWFSAKGHLCHFPWPSWGCDCDSEQFPLCRMAVFLYTVCVCVHERHTGSKHGFMRLWVYTLHIDTFHCSLFDFLFVCKRWSLLHFAQEDKYNSHHKQIDYIKKITVELNISQKQLLRVCFSPQGNGLVSPLSEGDLLIYSFLPRSQHFVNTASTIQETHQHPRTVHTGLAGQPEQNPNK